MVSTLLIVMQVALGTMIIAGSSCWLAVLCCSFFFRSRGALSIELSSRMPVTLLKPVYGLEKNLHANLRSACLQDYPAYQVVYSVQRLDDPAIPILQALQAEFGADRVTLAIENVRIGLNGKINNLAGALSHARHDVFVISDSDVRLRRDYLRTIVAPLVDPTVGAVSTFFKAVDAASWYEQMELLTINADHFAMAMLAERLAIADFCFGASTALRRDTLAAIGGLKGLGDYLVEDNEMGQRIVRAGKRLVVLRYVVDTTVDLAGPAQWWRKQTYWDQNTRAAIPLLFAATIVLRIIPLALMFAALRGFDAPALIVLCGALAIRLGSAAFVLGLALRDRDGLRCLWLIPVKDMLSLFWFTRAFVQRTVVWRGVEMSLSRDGRLLPLRTERSS